MENNNIEAERNNEDESKVEFRIVKGIENYLNTDIGEKGNWPVVYLLIGSDPKDKNKKKILYIGESTNVEQRFIQHDASKNGDTTKNRSHLSERHIIHHNWSSKSAAYLLESEMISMALADDKYKLDNKKLQTSEVENGHEFYEKERFKKEIPKIWDSLKEKGFFNFYSEELENQDGYRYSPFKSFDADQRKVIDHIRYKIEDYIDARYKSIKYNNLFTLLESKNFIKEDFDMGLVDQLKEENTENSEVLAKIIESLYPVRNLDEQNDINKKDLKRRSLEELFEIGESYKKWFLDDNLNYDKSREHDQDQLRSNLYADMQDISKKFDVKINELKKEEIIELLDDPESAVKLNEIIRDFEIQKIKDDYTNILEEVSKTAVKRLRNIHHIDEEVNEEIISEHSYDDFDNLDDERYDSFIHGSAGTGKTLIIIRAIIEFIDANRKILKNENIGKIGIYSAKKGNHKTFTNVLDKLNDNYEDGPLYRKNIKVLTDLKESTLKEIEYLVIDEAQRLRIWSKDAQAPEYFKGEGKEELYDHELDWLKENKIHYSLLFDIDQAFNEKDFEIEEIVKDKEVLTLYSQYRNNAGDEWPYFVSEMLQMDASSYLPKPKKLRILYNKIKILESEYKSNKSIDTLNEIQQLRKKIDSYKIDVGEDFEINFFNSPEDLYDKVIEENSIDDDVDEEWDRKSRMFATLGYEKWHTITVFTNALKGDNFVHKEYGFDSFDPEYRGHTQNVEVDMLFPGTKIGYEDYAGIWFKDESLVRVFDQKELMGEDWNVIVHKEDKAARDTKKSPEKRAQSIAHLKNLKEQVIEKLKSLISNEPEKCEHLRNVNFENPDEFRLIFGRVIRHYDIKIGDKLLTWNKRFSYEDWLEKSKIDEIGSAHTAQGRDFKYAGVILDKETILYRDGKIQASEKAKKECYILLTRGIWGTGIYSEDKETNEYFKDFVRRKIKGKITFE